MQRLRQGISLNAYSSQNDFRVIDGSLARLMFDSNAGIAYFEPNDKPYFL